jgi:hypothetical protein
VGRPGNEPYLDLTVSGTTELQWKWIEERGKWDWRIPASVVGWITAAPRP